MRLFKWKMKTYACDGCKHIIQGTPVKILGPDMFCDRDQKYCAKCYPTYDGREYYNSFDFKTGCNETKIRYWRNKYPCDRDGKVASCNNCTELRNVSIKLSEQITQLKKKKNARKNK